VIGRYSLVVGMLGMRRVFGMRGVFLRMLGVFVMGVDFMRVIIMLGVSLVRVIFVRMIRVIVTGVVVISMFVMGFRAGGGGSFDRSGRYFGRP
jgi:hypothetical protein